jgi:hypothetical protein
VMRPVAVHHSLGSGVAQGALDGIPPVNAAVAGAQVAFGETCQCLLDPCVKRAGSQQIQIVRDEGWRVVRAGMIDYCMVSSRNPFGKDRFVWDYPALKSRA